MDGQKNLDIEIVLFNVKIQKTPLEQALKKAYGEFLQLKFETELLELLQDKKKIIVFIHIFNQKTLGRILQFLKLTRSYIKKSQLLIIAISELNIPDIEKRLLNAGVHEFIDFFTQEKSLSHKISGWQKQLTSYRAAFVDGKEETIRINSPGTGLQVEAKAENLPLKTLLGRKTHDLLKIRRDSTDIEVHLNGKEINFILEDQDEQALIFKSKKVFERTWVNPSLVGPASLYLKYKYDEETSDLKLKGRLSDIERTEDGTEYFVVAYSNELKEEVQRFIQGYQRRQKDIGLFIDIVKGY